MHYNETFADKQGIDAEGREKLDEAYECLFYALAHPSMFSSVEAVVETWEFELQRLWKLPEDKKFHRYQLEIEGCTCPVLDNMELFGHTEGRYRVSDCPWHWKPKGEKNA